MTVEALIGHFFGAQLKMEKRRRWALPERFPPQFLARLDLRLLAPSPEFPVNLLVLESGAAAALLPLLVRPPETPAMIALIQKAGITLMNRLSASIHIGYAPA